jgi:hypothetical protein
MEVVIEVLFRGVVWLVGQAARLLMELVASELLVRGVKGARQRVTARRTGRHGGRPHRVYLGKGP